MARKPRLYLPGALYHVMLRGNDGQRIFHDDEERKHFLSLVSEGVGRYGHRIHAYCLMDNHVHFLIQIGRTPLSKVMQNLSFRYTRWIYIEGAYNGACQQWVDNALVVVYIVWAYTGGRHVCNQCP